MIDTNFAIAVLKEESTASALYEEYSQSLAIPAIVWGELVYGAYKSSYTQKNLENITFYFGELILLNVDRETALIVGKLRADLESAGIKLPVNDLWIAGIAFQHEAILLTRDRHFDHLPHLPKLSF